MDNTMTDSRDADVAHRLWRAYAPFRRGRDTSGDLTSMLAVLLLARFVESQGEPSDEFVTRWRRALAEASSGLSPLIDLRAAMRSAGSHPQFPLPDLRNLVGFLGEDESDDVPWVTAFLAVLDQRPMPAETDWLEVCELLLERYVQDGTSSDGEFYTPRAVTRLLIELMAPQPGDRILDPACGFGSLLAAAAERIAEPSHIDGATFEANATDRSNPPLAMMNMAIHGVDSPVVRAADPAALFQGRGNRLVDIVLCNPPFNQHLENIDISGGWPFGQPPESNANFAWLQLAWSRLSENGTAAVIMPRSAGSARRETEIRRQMTARGVLLGIIALPSNLFARTAIPVHVWVLARDKARHLPIDDTNAVLFIDASRLGVRAPRRSRVLTTEDIERISNRFQTWMRSPRTTPDEPGFSRSVMHEEILENGGNLDPRLYVDVVQDQSVPVLDIDHLLDELDWHDKAVSSSSSELRRSISISERLIRNGAEAPLAPLRSIVDDTVERIAEEARPGQLFAGPSGSLIRAKDYVDAGIPVVMPKDLTGTGFSTTSIRHISERQAEGLDRFRLRPGDIVLARRGELGRCAVAREEQRGWVCGTGCFLLRPPATLDADYFAVYLRGPEARLWLEAHATGGLNMKTIPLEALGDLPIMLPDVGTQQAIVDVVTRLDEHERLLRGQLMLTQQIGSNALNRLWRANA